MNQRLLKKNSAVLLIIDIQEAFRAHLADAADLARNANIMLDAAKLLDLPIIVTEQYPKGLGKTFAEISARAGTGAHYFEKDAFSCLGADGFREHLGHLGRPQVMVCGIEAHVCVNQTVHDLLAEGYSAHLIRDAISSRSAQNKEVGLEKMTGSGAVISCVEMALFELLRISGTDIFKAVQKLVK